jgi:hypothetical protein
VLRQNLSTLIRILPHLTSLLLVALLGIAHPHRVLELLIAISIKGTRLLSHACSSSVPRRL